MARWNDYPRCVSYLKNSLNAARLKKEKPKVWKALLRACGNQDKLLQRTLAYATAPELRVQPGMVQTRGGAACGRTISPHFVQADAIVIVASRVLAAFEFAVTASDIDRNRLPFEALILHELVHWVRGKAGLSDDVINDDSDPDVFGEAGELFEKWAYNRVFCVKAEVEASQSAIF